MSYTTDRAAIMTAIVTKLPFIPTQYPNRPVADQAGNAITPRNQLWRRVYVQSGESDVFSVGKTGNDQINGILNIDIFAPKGQGDVIATEHADAVVNELKWTRMSGVRFLRFQVTPLPDEENWYGIKVRVFFRSFHKRDMQ